MTKSRVVAEVLTQQQDTSTNDSAPKDIGTVANLKSCHVPDYKYKSNFPPHLIEELRQLMKFERAKQSDEERDYWADDFNRMMNDDWLVTRFFLRGFKASSLYFSNANSDGEYDENDDDEDDVDNDSEESTRKALGFKKTIELLETCGRFRKEYNVTTSTKLDEFPIEWVSAHGLFSYKPDLKGNPTLWLRVKLFKPKTLYNDQLRHDFKRFFLYMAEQCDKELFNRPGNCACTIWDMTSATFENYDLEFVTWMIKMSKLGPKFLNYVIIYNLPWFLNTTFKLVVNSFVLSKSNHTIKFAYGNQICNYIAKQNLPDYLLEQLNNK